MSVGVLLRPLLVATDAASVARIRSACSPDWPVTTEQVQQEEQRRPSDRWHIARVALIDDAVVGYGTLQPPLSFARPGRLRISIGVEPSQRGHGVGRALFEALLGVARDAGADELLAETRDQERSRFLTDRGFVAEHRRIQSRLAPTEVRAQTIAQQIDQATDAFFADGLRVASYRQLQLLDAHAARRLYELELTLWQDIPFGLQGELPSFETYQHEELADPNFLPEATFIALDGDQWIALAALARAPLGLLATITGVRSAWRRRGLARWLKLHTIRYALEVRAAGIVTFNDATNDGMMRLNASLGFVESAVEVRYRKNLR